MTGVDSLGNLFVALLAAIPLFIFLLFSLCACIEASLQAARRSYKPHLPTRVRFADEAEEVTSQRNLLFGLKSNRNNGSGRLEGSGLMAHSSYIQKFPNYRYNSVPGRTSPPLPHPVLKTRSEFRGSGSLKSPVSPLSESQRLLEREYMTRRGTPPKVGSPASYPPKGILISSNTSSCTPPPGRAIRQDTVSSNADTQSQLFSEKSSPTLTVSNCFSYFDGSRRSSTDTPTTTPTVQNRSKSPFESCGSQGEMKRRHSTPSSPTMYAYHYEQRPQTHSNYSSMSYLPEVRTYLNFMEDVSNRQRSSSFSGRPTRTSRSPRPHPYHVGSPRQTPSPLTFDLSQFEDEASKLSTPSSFASTFLTPPGSTDQGSFKSPESLTPDWLLSADIPSFRMITAVQGDDDGVNYKQPLSRSCSIRTAST